MKRTLVIFSLFICLNKTNAQTNTSGTTNATNSSSTTTAPDEANTDFRNKFQDTSKQTTKNKKTKPTRNAGANNNAPDEDNTDFRNKFQDTSRATSDKNKRMNHNSMNHSADSSHMKRHTSGSSSSATKPNE